MAMQFWEAERRARIHTTWYLAIFVVLTVGMAALAEFALRSFSNANTDPNFPNEAFYNPTFPYFGLFVLGVIFLVAGFNYALYRSQGGKYVAESVGARLISPNSRKPQEQQLLNIVSEMAIAASVPPPPVYILPAKEINAFAAGTTYQNAAITITQGALDNLSRDEIQGVIAHEMGHIYNGDMKIGMRLAAMIMGFVFLLIIGWRMLQITSLSGGRRRGGGANALPLIALLVMLVGALTWIGGAILRAAVSRQREYLADACSVQFTRNPEGIAGALRKIANENVHDMPKHGSAYAHMYLDDRSFWSSLFATHPPIEKRIAAIQGKND